MLNGNIVKGKLLFWNTSVINHYQIENKLNYFGSGYNIFTSISYLECDLSSCQLGQSE